MIIAHDGHRTNEPNGDENATVRQILHLAQPRLDTLPKGDGR